MPPKQQPPKKKKGVFFCCGSNSPENDGPIETDEQKARREAKEALVDESFLSNREHCEQQIITFMTENVYKDVNWVIECLTLLKEKDINVYNQVLLDRMGAHVMKALTFAAFSKLLDAVKTQKVHLIPSLHQQINAQYQQIHTFLFGKSVYNVLHYCPRTDPQTAELFPWVTSDLRKECYRESVLSILPYQAPRDLNILLYKFVSTHPESIVYINELLLLGANPHDELETAKIEQRDKEQQQLLAMQDVTNNTNNNNNNMNNSIPTNNNSIVGSTQSPKMFDITQGNQPANITEHSFYRTASSVQQAPANQQLQYNFAITGAQTITAITPNFNTVDGMSTTTKDINNNNNNGNNNNNNNINDNLSIQDTTTNNTTPNQATSMTSSGITPNGSMHSPAPALNPLLQQQLKSFPRTPQGTPQQLQQTNTPQAGKTLRPAGGRQGRNHRPSVLGGPQQRSGSVDPRARKQSLYQQQQQQAPVVVQLTSEEQEQELASYQQQLQSTQNSTADNNNHNNSSNNGNHHILATTPGVALNINLGLINEDGQLSTHAESGNTSWAGTPRAGGGINPLTGAGGLNGFQPLLGSNFNPNNMGGGDNSAAVAALLLQPAPSGHSVGNGSSSELTNHNNHNNNNHLLTPSHQHGNHNNPFAPGSATPSASLIKTQADFSKVQQQLTSRKSVGGSLQQRKSIGQKHATLQRGSLSGGRGPQGMSQGLVLASTPTADHHLAASIAQYKDGIGDDDTRQSFQVTGPIISPTGGGNRHFFGAADSVTDNNNNINQNNNNNNNNTYGDDQPSALMHSTTPGAMPHGGEVGGGGGGQKRGVPRRYSTMRRDQLTIDSLMDRQSFHDGNNNNNVNNLNHLPGNPSSYQPPNDHSHNNNNTQQPPTLLQQQQQIERPINTAFFKVFSLFEHLLKRYEQELAQIKALQASTPPPTIVLCGSTGSSQQQQQSIGVNVIGAAGNDSTNRNALQNGTNNNNKDNSGLPIASNDDDTNNKPTQPRTKEELDAKYQIKMQHLCQILNMFCSPPKKGDKVDNFGETNKDTDGKMQPQLTLGQLSTTFRNSQMDLLNFSAEANAAAAGVKKNNNNNTNNTKKDINNTEVELTPIIVQNEEEDDSKQQPDLQQSTFLEEDIKLICAKLYENKTLVQVFQQTKYFKCYIRFVVDEYRLKLGHDLALERQEEQRQRMEKLAEDDESGLLTVVAE